MIAQRGNFHQGILFIHFGVVCLILTLFPLIFIFFLSFFLLHYHLLLTYLNSSSCLLLAKFVLSLLSTPTLIVLFIHSSSSSSLSSPPSLLSLRFPFTHSLTLSLSFYLIRWQCLGSQFFHVCWFQFVRHDWIASGHGSWSERKRRKSDIALVCRRRSEETLHHIRSQLHFILRLLSFVSCLIN